MLTPSTPPARMKNAGVRCAAVFLVGLLLASAQPAAAELVPDEISPVYEMIEGGGGSVEANVTQPVMLPSTPAFEDNNSPGLKICTNFLCMDINPHPCLDVLLAGATIRYHFNGGVYVQAGSGPGAGAGYANAC